jgi:uncharacterized membrane protein affecting hemolysin expression
MFIRLITWNNILAPYLGYVRLKLQISIQQKHFRQFFFLLLLLLLHVLLLLLLLFIYFRTPYFGHTLDVYHNAS